MTNVFLPSASVVRIRDVSRKYNKIKIIVVGNVIPCSLIDRHQRVGGR